jgi:organic radical activating enzyme
MRQKITKDPMTVEELRHSSLPVIIFGAGVVGEALFHACRQLGIRVECFCDNNINKSGRMMCEVPIVYSHDLKTRYDDAIFLISIADIQDIISKLHSLGFERWETCQILEQVELSSLPVSSPREFVSFTVNTCLACHKSYLNPDLLFLHSVDLIVTERCSLRCRNCSNLMQYYEKPRNCELGEMLAAIDALTGAVDEINDFRVIGGEPLMNPEVHLVVRKLTPIAKIKKVVIYTNGTLKPRPEQMADFADDKVLFIITDYGELSRNLKPLITMLDQQKIAYYLNPAAEWNDCSGLSRHDYTPERLRKMFAACCVKNLLTLSGTRLYHCPFLANAARLQAMPDNAADYVELVSDASQEDLRRRLKFFIESADLFPGCNYCDGRTWDGEAIPPAIQTDRPLPYQRYEP